MHNTEKSTLEQLTDIVVWYHNINKEFSDLGKLQNCARKMATLLFFHATEVAALYQEKNAAEYMRESKRDRKKSELINAGSSATAADVSAREFVATYLYEEQRADSSFQKVKILHESAKDVLNAVQQHVSNLKAERNLELRGGMVQQQ